MSEQTEAPNKITWHVDSSDPELASKVREALREVVDPELGINVIELGLIRNLDVMPDRAHLTMILTTPFCPYGPAIMEETRKKAQTTVGVPTTIEMGLEMWSPEMMEEGAGADWGLF
jgi:metal-sulfur cluster biosynthetic enzyme